MELEFSGSPSIKAPRALIWSRLLDPQALAACTPGVESVEVADGTHWQVVSGIGVGTLKFSFTMDVELSQLREQESAQMTARGKAAGSAVEVNTGIIVREGTAGETILSWRATAQISGLLARAGAPLLESAVKKLTDDFWSTFAEQTTVAAAS